MSFTHKDKLAAFLGSNKFVGDKKSPFPSLDIPPESPRGLPFLPIEWLKNESLTWFKGKQIAKTFLSSGTESARSQSHFSEEGLLAYQTSALQGFSEFMARESIEFEKIVSFVPDTSAWPDSSLAQMIAWFGDFFPLEYLDIGQRDQIAGSFKEESASTLYIGTAFHWINLIDSGFSERFPKSSYLLETGGTKGQSRQLNRSEFYTLLRLALQVSNSQILSEYGMSELSSQAWSRGDEKSTYRFSSWVKLQVIRGSQTLPKGEGSLLIEDPSRLDYPYTFRVQDLASLDDDGFQILGRVPHAPLKGCSLLAEQPPRPPSPPVKSSGSLPMLSRVSFKDLRNAYLDLLNRSTFLEALGEEFYSRDLAISAVHDLNVSFYKNQSDLDLALYNSELSTPQVTIIPPSTHSLAILHPLTLALALGARINIRIPEAFEDKGSSLLILLDHFARHFPGRIQLLSRGLKWSGSENDTLVFFGSDLTLKEVKSIYKGRLSAFGSAAALSIVSQKENLSLAVKDALSLAGKGCMSSRAIYLVDLDLKEVIQEIEKLRNKIPTLNLSVFESSALDHEETDFLQKKVPFLKRKSTNDILFSFPGSLSIPFSNRLFSVMFYKLEKAQVDEFVSGLGTSVFLSTDLDLKIPNSGLIQRPLGQLNISPFNGFHQNRPIFSPSI